MLQLHEAMGQRTQFFTKKRTQHLQERFFSRAPGLEQFGILVEAERVHQTSFVLWNSMLDDYEYYHKS